ncbi:oxygen-insensitive NADPH nitroreductase [Desulfofustis glycolicus]|uniref:Nitroreductase n=1 Tax=Desulfofustis glycolicus DSM 9705 TaxID=1121409 RepID=A0A1M5XVH0_9BACT|nr:oxygen-insensitive NADPH nitroreductase [Desulfofustis glycolicus]MCB2217178.1 oxygen-insensitive NADPH nitroreductase [Desulfobulbaceae bacterium]SHI03719.1 nitroreductase [Desulfofustis glycolicus DSM 9705]
MNDVLKLLTGHRSIRKFTDRAVDQSIVEELIRAGQCAATSSFIQACTVIQVNDRQSRQALCEYTAGQKYVLEAPVFLVFCADMQRHRLACSMHGSTMLSGYTEQFLTASLDCALFAQNVMVGAESLGLGGCYIGAIRNRIGDADSLLGLPELVYPVFGMCLGYPAQDPETKPRLPLDVVLKQERYEDAGDDAAIETYDERVRVYYRTRTGGTKDNSWSEQIADMLVKEARPHMFAFLQSKGFLLK